MTSNVFKQQIMKNTESTYIVKDKERKGRKVMKIQKATAASQDFSKKEMI